MPITRNEEDIARKLLAKAADPSITTEEAEALTAKASAYLTRLNIDAAMLDARAAKKEIPTIEEFKIDNPFSLPKIILFQGIAKSFACRSVRTQSSAHNDGTATIKVFGFEGEIQSTRILYIALLAQLVEESYVQKCLGNTSKAFQNSFWYAFAERIAELLAKTTELVVSNETSGTQLVLRARKTEVDLLVKKTFPLMGTFYGKSTSAAGRQAGREAANRANLHQPTGPRRKAIGQ